MARRRGSALGRANGRLLGRLSSVHAAISRWLRDSRPPDACCSREQPVPRPPRRRDRDVSAACPAASVYIARAAEPRANIEARDKYGDSPLSLAVRRFDFGLTKALLNHGASLDSLNEDKIFSWNFTQLELKNYPLTLNIIEVMQLLQSAGYEVNLHTRIRMIKFCLKVRGNDTEHSIPYGTEWKKKCVA
ncbi:unnamed protein product [Trichogramma brassicae]|uniref:Uncharacterized protein n=1 Tax=Trichogramma brassicae TaxID=86971 RepID=A0A6H5IAM1_9HYME|nr:unnamed protein product [Trichogramma brassicae]